MHEPKSPLTSVLQTVATDIGWGFLAIAAISIRARKNHVQPDLITGVGFSSDPLRARFAAEGEAIERATWRMGGIWNDACLAKVENVLPEEIRTTITNELQDTLPGRF